MFSEIFVLLIDKGVDAVKWLDKGIGRFFNGERINAGGTNHDVDGSKEGDKDRELDEERQDGAERLDVFALVKIHHLERFKLAVALAVLFNLSKFGLDLAHQASLAELLFEQRPHGDFDDDGEDDDGDTEVADEVEGHEEEVDNGADDDHVYEFKHSCYYSIENQS